MKRAHTILTHKGMTHGEHPVSHIKIRQMKKRFLNNLLPILMLFAGLTIIGPGCQPNDPTNNCDEGISYKLDGTRISFDNTLVTAEIFNDAAIGKFYDIWTDENSGFYYHSTITETGETSPFSSDWFTTNDVANIVFLNSKNNVVIQFEIDEGANSVNDQVTISFSGTYEENGTTHNITDGIICTTIDIVH